jgi:hypothetical protein
MADLEVHLQLLTSQAERYGFESSGIESASGGAESGGDDADRLPEKGKYLPNQAH